MKIDTIAQLVARLQHSSIDSVDLQTPHTSLKLRWAPKSGTPSPPKIDDPSDAIPPTIDSIIIKAARMGQFLDAHPLHPTTQTHQTSLVDQRVQAGQILGYLQADTVLVAIRAPVDGVLHQTLVSHHDVVGYGQPLYVLNPDSLY